MVPFLEWVLTAVVIAYVLYPPYQWLTEWLGEQGVPRQVRETGAAVALIVALIVVFIVPVLYVASSFLTDLRRIASGEITIPTAAIEADLQDLLGVEVNIQSSAEMIGRIVLEAVYGGVPNLLSMLLQMTLGIAIALFAVFYLLRDGPALVRWLRDLSPMPQDVEASLIHRIDRTTYGAVVGHIFAAVVQAIVAGIGLFLVGIPNVPFWTIVMVLLAFLPVIGVFLIWAPAAVFLFLSGQTASAVFLAVYGLTIISFIDYYVRPIVIDRQAQLNPAVILIGVFGGVYTIGFVGLFVGPVLIGILVAILETFRVEFEDETTPTG